MDAALAHLSKFDSCLAELINAYEHPQLSPHTNYYQELASSIISQQLSVKAAATIEKRFIGLFDDSIFPTPEQILAKNVEELRTAGLSRPKAGYIQDLASKVLDGTIRFDHFDTRSNQEIIDELTKVKGIGVWTVHMFLMFCMGRLDVLPTGDLGIKNGIKKVYGLVTLPTSDDIETIARDNKWHPYESVASWYIWQCLKNVPKS